MEPRDDLVPMMMHMMMEMWLVKLGDVTAALGGEAVAIRSGHIKNNLLISYIFLRLVSIFLNSYAPCRFSQILTRVSILNEI